MARRDEIIGWLDELLEIAAFDDYGPNGLQVPGAAEVSKVATGVTPNLEFLLGARDAGAELAIAHHLLFVGDGPRAISEQMATRLRTLLSSDLALAAYHLPLDAHPEVGNNALLCAELGLERTQGRFAEFKGRPIGVIGRAAEPLAAAELIRRVAEVVGREPLVFDAGPDRVRTVGVVTGGASSAIVDAGAVGLDALVTGEPSEHVMGDARELGVHFIAAGHYATETFGVRRLGELVAERFGVEHEFVDVPNPI